jgi:hypothetical protein
MQHGLLSVDPPTLTPALIRMAAQCRSQKMTTRERLRAVRVTNLAGVSPSLPIKTDSQIDRADMR